MSETIPTALQSCRTKYSMARVKYTLDITEGVDEVWFSRMSRIDCRINNASAPWASSKKEYEVT